VGDRELLAVRPPTFDAPETTGLFDTRTRALFTADCFGALLTEPAESATEVAASDLAEGLVTWTGVDAPWFSSLTDRAFGEGVERIRGLDPSSILSGHLPPAPGEMAASLVGCLEQARSAEPFVGPDQEALRAMLEAA
jgi:hypothetical protein